MFVNVNRETIHHDINTIKERADKPQWSSLSLVMAHNFDQQHALEKGYIPRVAIVTGAVQGIGYAIARRLAESGIDIAVNDIPSKNAHIDTVVSELRTLGRRAIGVPGDVSDEEDVKQIIQRTAEELGSVDIVSCYFPYIQIID